MPITPDHTSYPVLDFLKWQQDGTLDLRPPFQRNAVWRPALKSSLIDSLLRGYPIPALFLQDRSDPTSFERKIVVVDGQQRLRTILSYVDIGCLPDADERDEFTLSPIHDPERPNASFQDLDDTDRGQILNSRLTVYVVDAGVSEAELLEIFRRMNTYGAKLNAQELRNAQYSGLFKEVAYRLAADFFDYWIKWGTLNKQDIAEMKDAEFTSDLMLLALDGTLASTAKRLDSAYEEYEDVFPLADKCIRRVASIMKILDQVFRERGQVRRLTKRMWVYSLFDAIQQVRLGGPINGDPGPKTKLTGRELKQVATAVNAQIEAEELPELVSQATRGAANDHQSRDVRADYLVQCLTAA
jgi:hypothetical protein